MSRPREAGAIAYAARSRRSGGLSVGINLFPGGKRCSLDCPYCEVFPFSGGGGFSLGRMEAELRAELAAARERGEPVRDVCFSGCGEPTISADFPAALDLASRVRGEGAPSAALVLITNGEGLLSPPVFSVLRDAALGAHALDVWLKLDAATAGWGRKINAGPFPPETMAAKIKEFAALAPVTIQTMLCEIDGEEPPAEEAAAWERLVAELAAGGNVRKVQIYGKARPSPGDPKARALPAARLELRAASLRAALGSPAPRVEVYP